MKELLFNSLDYWHSGGILLIPIALVSIGIWGYFLRSRNLLNCFIHDSRKFKKRYAGETAPLTIEALEKESDKFHSGITAVILPALRDAASGVPLGQALDKHETTVMQTLRRDLIILGALTAAAPLLGLLGTVTGMIQTFEAVSNVSGNTGVRVADGISQALITTQFGLIVALPGIFGSARLGRMLSNTHALLAECRTHLLAAQEQELKGTEA